MWKLLALVVSLVAALPPAAPASPAPLTDLQREACSSELEVLDRRTRLFRGQGLVTAEIARRNELSQAALDECLAAFKLRRAADQERLADLEELERRVGSDATEAARAEAWAQLRRERLASKPRSRLTADEKAELNAGSTAEVAETHATLDTVHARDPAFMRMVHSALACYHGVRRDRLRDQLAAEQARLMKGADDRQKVYALQSDLRQSDEVLTRSRVAAREWKGGLLRCTQEQVAVLTRCLSVQFDERPAEPACESAVIQQYVRFVK
jgi:hypothetical protein